MPIIGYVDMVADLFHYGHVRMLKKAKANCDYLIAGIHDDETVESYKRTPIMNMSERIEVVEACKYTDQVISSTPLIITKDFLENYNIDLVFHAHTAEEHPKYEYMYREIIDKFRRLDYTEEISTTDIIDRLKNRYIC